MRAALAVALLVSGCATFRDVVLLPYDAPARIACLTVERDSGVSDHECYRVRDRCRPTAAPVGYGCLPAAPAEATETKP